MKSNLFLAVIGLLVVNLGGCFLFETEPDAPHGLTASVGTGLNAIHLSWNNVSTAEYYTVYRATSGTAFTSLGTSIVEYNDLAVFPGVSYSYNLTASNDYGESVHSNTVTCTFTVAPVVLPFGGAAVSRTMAAEEYGYYSFTVPSATAGSSVTVGIDSLLRDLYDLDFALYTDSLYSVLYDEDTAAGTPATVSLDIPAITADTTFYLRIRNTTTSSGAGFDLSVY